MKERVLVKYVRKARQWCRVIFTYNAFFKNWPIILLIALICGGFFIFKYFGAPENEEMANWRTYKHDIIGIEFRYPEEWGEAYIVPFDYRYLTNLSSWVEKYDKGQAYYGSIYIKFPNTGGNIKIHIFNEYYEGSKHSNGNAHKYGYIDNIPELKTTKNICNYIMHFDHPPRWDDAMKEIYEDCSNNIKTALIKSEQASTFLNKTLYTYSLRHYAFKNLENSYFDNVLISFHAGLISRTENNSIVFDEFFEQVESNIDIDEFNKQKNIFINFVGSISSIKNFTPLPLAPKTFENIEGENPDITTIRKYYFLLENGDLEGAYEIREPKKVDFEEFQEWYGNTFMANPSQFEELDINKYKFNVDYQDNNEKPEEYIIVMEVNNDKINASSSERILSEKATMGNLSAFAKERNNRSYMILVENNEEIIIEEFSVDSESVRLSNYTIPQFSSDGNYLLYNVVGDKGGVRIYDVKNKKIIKKLDSVYEYGFTSDAEHFYACAANHGYIMYARVYSVPDFNIEYDLEKEEDFSDLSYIVCQYDKNKKIRYKTTEYYEGDSRHRVIEYSFDTDKAQEVSE